ncbi:MAG TPA: hypothetical protein VL442_09225 [Mucilaginibacter sp.]|jgi:hypothetical protein|nr:hypothetical protein [Mucilaginibacter sp.]
MDNEFEKYLQQNRDRFENGSPSNRVWEKLQRNLVEHQARRHRVIRMRRISCSIAASILLCVAATLIIFNSRSQINSNTIAGNISRRDSMIDRQKIMAQKIALDSAERVAGVTDDKIRQSLYQYTQLIESRQKQIAVLQQVNPELYVSSQKVLTDLDQVYRRLQKQLPGSPDQQKVLQQLLQNLKMQEQILSNQLQLLEELQTPDNSADGKKDKKI